MVPAGRSQLRPHAPRRLPMRVAADDTWWGCRLLTLPEKALFTTENVLFKNAFWISFFFCKYSPRHRSVAYKSWSSVAVSQSNRTFAQWPFCPRRPKCDVIYLFHMMPSSLPGIAILCSVCPCSSESLRFRRVVSARRPIQTPSHELWIKTS